MKIQNFAIIFLVIAIPIILLLAYYLHLQQETLRMQIDYNAKLSEATKEGIETYEINSVELKTLNTERENVEATINSFITSLSNKLNIYGTAREYIENYLPAIVFTVYDGYYTYAPNQILEDIKTNTGEIVVEDGKINFKENSGTTIDISDSTKQQYSHSLSNKIAYSAAYSGKTSKDETIDLTINYTLDNRVYIYGKIGETIIEDWNKNYKDGYLVYFDNYNTKNIEPKTLMPRISVSTASKNCWNPITKYLKPNSNNTEADLYKADLYKIVYKGKDTTNYNGIAMAAEGITIEPEILEEQISYIDGLGREKNATFKYVYTVEHSTMETGKLYYDEEKGDFFYLDSNKQRHFIKNDEKTYYKTVSVLWENESGTGEAASNITKYIKLYQPLNGSRKGYWYFPKLTDDGKIKKDSENKPEIDFSKEVEYTKDDRNVIYYDYSAISYYVESFALTNWVRINLGNAKELYCTAITVNEQNYSYDVATTDISLDKIFKIDENNDPETEGTAIVTHRKKIMKDNIIANLNLAISNYNNNNSDYHYQIPVLTEADWEKLFRNISLLTFFQGVPIGLKEYNNYAIETSTINKEYVDPYEIYFSSQAHSYTAEEKKRNGYEIDDAQEPYHLDQNFHRVNCEHVKEANYTGYRAWEYTRVEKFKEKKYYYYKHDVSEEVYVEISSGPPIILDYFNDKNSELACYYCIINKNYKQSEILDTTKRSNKSYNEALARERYYQKEKIGIISGTMWVKTENSGYKIPNMLLILDASSTMNGAVWTQTITKTEENGTTTTDTVNRNEIYSVQVACSDFLRTIRDTVIKKTGADQECNIVITSFNKNTELVGVIENTEDIKNTAKITAKTASKQSIETEIVEVMENYKYKTGGSGILTVLDTTIKKYVKNSSEEWIIIVMTDRNSSES